MPTTPLSKPITGVIGTDTPVDVTHFIGENATGTSYAIAHTCMQIVDWLLGIFGLQHHENLVTILYVTVVLALSLAVGFIAKAILLGLLKIVTRKWSPYSYQLLTQQHFFHKIVRIIPPLVFLILIQFTFTTHISLDRFFTKLCVIYIVYVSASSMSALVMAIWEHINTRENKKKLPLRGLAQLAKGIIWIIAAVVILGILVDKSVTTLLAGFGAFAAVLMLIFKDSILGLVAGVQLSENDSLHVGDWIKVNGTDANGIVQEVTLTTVKILNWDKTTTSLPPYSLVSGSFTNMRTMQESGTRRICRSYMIDADSVLPATPAMLDNLRKVPYMNDYIAKKLEQRAAGQVADVSNPAGLVDGTIDTNLGLFRAYVKMWIDDCPLVSHTSDCFITTLPQTSAGIPLQIYCFTSTSKWFPYEATQATIFEHISAMLHVFQLYTFENPSGRDTVTDGWLSPGHPIDNVFGIPYPFFADKNAPDMPDSSLPADHPDMRPTSPGAAMPGNSSQPASSQGKPA